MDCEERGTFWLTLKSDYKILFATTAEEGLEMLSENVGLVFLSMRLPDMNSMEVFRLIKKEHPSTPIIIITACGNEEKRTEVFGEKATDLAKRPLNSEEIIQEIKILIDMNNAPERHQDASLTTEATQDEQYPDIPPHLVNGILKVRDFVTQNYSESLTLTAACKMASTSKTYFCRFFKDITGHSLRTYQNVVKVRRAEELLRDKRLSVKDIALKLGYSDPNYFSTIYKKITGISPKYRKASGQNLEKDKEVSGKT